MKFDLTYYWFFICIPLVLIELFWGIIVLFNMRPGMTSTLKYVPVNSGQRLLQN